MVKKLLLFIPIFLLLLIPTNVFALPTLNETGYLISPCTGNQFQLGSFLWAYGDFPFYGWNGSSGTNGCPYSSQFYSQQYSSFIIETQGNFNQSSPRGGYQLRFFLSRTLNAGDTYDITIRLRGDSLSYYFNGVSSVDNAQLLDTSLTCSSSSDCNLNYKIKVNNNITTLNTNINSPSEGLNGYYFNYLVSSLYYPVITYSNSNVDTSGIENNQQTIINQNQTEINQNNTIINQNSDMLQKQQETNELLEQQQESQKVCTSYDKGSVKHSSKILDNNGELVVASASWGVTDFIPITKNYSMQIKQNYSGTSNAYLCFYDDTKTKISCQLEQNIPINTDVTIPNNASFFRYSIVIFSNVPQLEICSNGNQALSDDINNLNDTLNSTDTPNTNEDIEDMEDMLASDTPISDLITMPLTLMHAYINGINATCSPVNLGTLYGTTLTIPCLNLQQKLGSDLWSKIDVLFSIFMCYNIGMLFITAFSGITSLRDDFDSLYVPKHADTGYQPKHGGGS